MLIAVLWLLLLVQLIRAQPVSACDTSFDSSSHALLLADSAQALLASDIVLLRTSDLLPPPASNQASASVISLRKQRLAIFWTAPEGLISLMQRFASAYESDELILRGARADYHLLRPAFTDRLVNISIQTGRNAWLDARDWPAAELISVVSTTGLLEELRVRPVGLSGQYMAGGVEASALLAREKAALGGDVLNTARLREWVCATGDSQHPEIPSQESQGFAKTRSLSPASLFWGVDALNLALVLGALAILAATLASWLISWWRGR